jgi:hypothetical protein
VDGAAASGTCLAVSARALEGCCWAGAGLWLAGTAARLRVRVWVDEAGACLGVSARVLMGAGIDCGTAANELAEKKPP